MQASDYNYLVKEERMILKVNIAKKQRAKRVIILSSIFVISNLLVNLL